MMMFHQAQCPPHEAAQLTCISEAGLRRDFYMKVGLLSGTQPSDVMCDNLTISHLAVSYQFRRPVGLTAPLCPN